MEVLEMRKRYINPEVEMLEFDTKDVITTSGETDLGGVGGDPKDANDLNGWSILK